MEFSLGRKPVDANPRAPKPRRGDRTFAPNRAGRCPSQSPVLRLGLESAATPATEGPFIMTPSAGATRFRPLDEVEHHEELELNRPQFF